MDGSLWLFDASSDWAAAFIAFSIVCIVLGHVARPLVALASSCAAAVLLAVMAPLPAVPALALLVVPLAAGCGAAVLRAGKVKADLFLAFVLLQVSAVLSVFVEHSMPAVLALGVAFAASKIAPRMSLRAVYGIATLPTLVLLLTLLLMPQVLSYELRSGPEDSATAIVGPLATLAVAILGSMVWVRWREQRAAQRNNRP